MCEMCLANCIEWPQVVPGFYLARAQRDGHILKAGEYCLAEGHYPLLIWDFEPMIDPETKYSLDPWEVPEDEDQAWWDQVKKLEAGAQVDPLEAWRLIDACLKAGYNPDKHGTRWACWLLNRVAVFLETVPPREDVDHDEP